MVPVRALHCPALDRARAARGHLATHWTAHRPAAGCPRRGGSVGRVSGLCGGGSPRDGSLVALCRVQDPVHTPRGTEGRGAPQAWLRIIRAPPGPGRTHRTGTTGRGPRGMFSGSRAVGQCIVSAPGERAAALQRGTGWVSRSSLRPNGSFTRVAARGLWSRNPAR